MALVTLILCDNMKHWKAGWKSPHLKRTSHPGRCAFLRSIRALDVCGMIKDVTMSDLLTARFRASIPPIMSGIKTGGDGMRVQFDIPETDMGEGVKLLAMRGKRLIVTVEVAKDKLQGVDYGL